MDLVALLVILAVLAGVVVLVSSPLRAGATERDRGEAADRQLRAEAIDVLRELDEARGG